MRVSKEFLLEAVGMTMLVALILISVQIFNRTTKITDMISQKQEQQLASLEEYDVIRYDGLYIDGITAVNYIKVMVGNYDLPVLVLFGQREFVIEKEEQCKELRETSSEMYINPFALFFCEIIRDENEVIQEIKLSIKEGEGV